MELKVDVKGFKELEAALKQLPPNLAKRALERAVRAGAGIIRAEARRRAPADDGDLRKAIVVRKDRHGPSSVNYKVGVSYKAYYAHMVEFGTDPHTITLNKKNNRKVMRDKKTGKFYGKSVRHPGASAQPFLRPAFDETQDQVIRKVGEILAQSIAREATKFVGR